VQYQNIKIVNKSFAIVTKLKYLEITTNQNYILEEMKDRLKTQNPSHLVHNL